MRVGVRANTRDNVFTQTRDDARACMRVEKHAHTTDDVHDYTRVNIQEDPSNWDPGGVDRGHIDQIRHLSCGLVGKVGDQMEDTRLAKDNIVENHQKPCNQKKETFEKREDGQQCESQWRPHPAQAPGAQQKMIGAAGLVKKMVNNAKANGGHTMPSLQEPSNKMLNTAGLVRKMTFGTTKDKRLAIKECPNIKAGPSIKSNEIQPRIKQDKV